MKVFIATLTLLIGAVFLPAPAQAVEADPGHSYFNWSSGRVAEHINCKGFFRFPDQREPGRYNKDAGVCFLKGYRVNVITFSSIGKERGWSTAAVAAFGPRFHWAYGAGVIIVAKNGNRAAAETGAFAISGKVRHG